RQVPFQRLDAEQDILPVRFARHQIAFPPHRRLSLRTFCFPSYGRLRHLVPGSPGHGRMAGATVADGFRAVGSRERRSFSNEWMACRGFETFHQKNDVLFEKSHKIRAATRSATDFCSIFRTKRHRKARISNFFDAISHKISEPPLDRPDRPDRLNRRTARIARTAWIVAFPVLMARPALPVGRLS